MNKNDRRILKQWIKMTNTKLLLKIKKKIENIKKVILNINKHWVYDILLNFIMNKSIKTIKTKRTKIKMKCNSKY